jgi:deoxyribonuclease V
MERPEDPMEIAPRHAWDLDAVEARALQVELAREVDVTTPLGPYRVIAAADVSFDRGGEELYAAVVVVRAGSFELIERVGLAGPAAFPYVPGLLSFREAPALIEAFRRVRARPDVVLCDGQGVAHPRRLGIASHVGLWLGLPTVGCAKSLLCGSYDEPGPNRGERSPLVHRGEVVGAVVRTRDRVAPLFVSPGHLCDLEGAVSLVLATTVKYRLPVPSRMAHDFVNQVRRAVTAGQPIPE